jgi:hypothetical protein
MSGDKHSLVAETVTKVKGTFQGCHIIIFIPENVL